MTIKDYVNKYHNIIILSGAGVSTASGLKDFRSEDGLFSEKGIDPIKLLSRDHYNVDPQSTIDYIVDKFNVSDEVEANLGHEFAYDLYKEGKLLGVVTQNIDGLYEKTKLPKDYIINIHGEGSKFVCTNCRKSLTIEDLNEKNRSSCCDHIVDTDVILYGDDFHLDSFIRYYGMIHEADLIIVMGTSLHISAHTDNVRYVDTRLFINNEKLEYDMELFNERYIGDINEILKSSYYDLL